MFTNRRTQQESQLPREIRKNYHNFKLWLIPTDAVIHTDISWNTAASVRWFSAGR